MEPRYQCLALDQGWTWRLLGSNHRELARSGRKFPSEELAAQDALAVGGLAATAPIDVSVAADTSWHWVLVVDGEPLAMSSAHYARRLECLRAVARFRDCAPGAHVDAPPLDRRGRGSSAPRRTMPRGTMPG